MGRSGSSFVVNAASPKKRTAIAFLKWLTDKDPQVYLANMTNNLPANRTRPQLTPILANFCKRWTIHPSLAVADAGKTRVAEALLKGFSPF